MNQSLEYMRHLARCAEISAQPLTWAQFIWTLDNATRKTYSKRVKRPSEPSRGTFLPDRLQFVTLTNRLEFLK